MGGFNCSRYCFNTYLRQYYSGRSFETFGNVARDNVYYKRQDLLLDRQVKFTQIALARILHTFRSEVPEVVL